MTVTLSYLQLTKHVIIKEKKKTKRDECDIDARGENVLLKGNETKWAKVRLLTSNVSKIVETRILTI